MLAVSCSSWTNKLITAKDHASVQINVGHLNENGQYDGNFTTIALAGKVRAMVSAPAAGCGSCKWLCNVLRYSTKMQTKQCTAC